MSCPLCGGCEGGVAIGGYKKQKVSRRTGSNAWIDHVKRTQQQYGCSYKEAMQIAKQTY